MIVERGCKFSKEVEVFGIRAVESESADLYNVI